MFKITELPEYIQSFLPHLIVEDEKREGEPYYAFSPEMIQWVNENKSKYSNCPSILQTCDDLTKVYIRYRSCAVESVPGEESFMLRFVIHNVQYPSHLSVLIDDFFTACNIEGYNPENIVICCNHYEPTCMKLYFHKKI